MSTSATLAFAAVAMLSLGANAASPPLPSQHQNQGQIQHQSQSSKNINRNSSYSKSSASQSNSQVTNEQRPSGVAPSVGLGGFASGPCVGVTTQGGIGIGLPGGASFGAGGGRSELDNECTLREWYRLLIAAGHPGLANELLDQSEVIQKLRANRKKADTMVEPPAVAKAERHPGCNGSMVNKDGDFYKQNCL